MRLRTGFLRLWVVLSIAWIVIVGDQGYSLWSSLGPWTYYQKTEGFEPLPDKAAEDNAAKELVDLEHHATGYGKDPTIEEIHAYLSRRRIANFLQSEEKAIVRSHLEWGAGPPLALLISGVAFWWVATGFRGSTPR
jgi:hypothetical protein